jgi:hypothetical protein
VNFGDGSLELHSEREDDDGGGSSHLQDDDDDNDDGDNEVENGFLNTFSM